MSELLPADPETLLNLARFRILDRRNCNEEAMMKLLGTLADEVERLRRDLEIQTVNATAVLQAQHERDCAVEEQTRLSALLNDAADPVACQLAEARRNLDLYKGYSSRERRYSYEIEQLERLQKAIGAVTRTEEQHG